MSISFTCLLSIKYSSSSTRLASAACSQNNSGFDSFNFNCSLDNLSVFRNTLSSMSRASWSRSQPVAISDVETVLSFLGGLLVIISFVVTGVCLGKADADTLVPGFSFGVTAFVVSLTELTDAVSTELDELFFDFGDWAILSELFDVFFFFGVADFGAAFELLVTVGEMTVWDLVTGDLVADSLVTDDAGNAFVIDLVVGDVSFVLVTFGEALAFGFDTGEVSAWVCEPISLLTAVCDRVTGEVEVFAVVSLSLVVVSSFIVDGFDGVFTSFSAIASLVFDGALATLVLKKPVSRVWLFSLVFGSFLFLLGVLVGVAFAGVFGLASESVLFLSKRGILK